MYYTNNYRIILFFSLLLANTKISNAQSSLQFNSIDSVLQFAEKNSTSSKVSHLQSLSAKWTKIAAYGNVVNFKSPFTASWTDNITLPISYLPAEAFGGPVGSFKQVSLGQQYVTSYNLTPQIDIINLSAWARIKSAEVNKQLTETNNLIAKKNLFESISATYYNIVSLNYQIKNVEQSIIVADSILLIAKNKFSQGIIREQDVTNANINVLTTQDKLNQLKFLLEQNYNSLKILCDTKIETEIKITETIENNDNKDDLKAVRSTLNEKQSYLQAVYSKSELNVNRLSSFAPTLSLIFNQNWQRNSNVSFTDAKANKFTSQFIGLRFTVPFPLDVNRLSTNYTAKINYKIAETNYEHIALQSNLLNKQMDLDFEKAKSTYNTAKKIAELKKINYTKSLNQYNEGILPMDLLLIAFNDKINAQLNYSTAFAALKYNEAKININNSFK